MIGWLGVSVGRWAEEFREQICCVYCTNKNVTFNHKMCDVCIRNQTIAYGVLVCLFGCCNKGGFCEIDKLFRQTDNKQECMRAD